MADAWVRTPNTHPRFGGRAPLATMGGEGEEALVGVLRLLEAWAEGRDA